MHNRIDLAVFDSAFFRFYVEINEKFAEIVQRQARETDLVWVHDYHFLLLGGILREEGWQGRCWRRCSGTPRA